MPDIALHPFHVTTRIRLTVEVGYELAQDLQRYQAFYKQAYGAEVSEADLLREMARRFMDSDREFQMAKHGIKARSRTPRQGARSGSAEPVMPERKEA